MKTHLILNQLQDVLPYCAPSILAEMVEYWCDDESTLALAQAALAEGVSNCGLNSLASYLNPDKPESVLQGWRDAGLEWQFEDESE